MQVAGGSWSDATLPRVQQDPIGCSRLAVGEAIRPTHPAPAVSANCADGDATPYDKESRRRLIAVAKA